MVKTISGVLFSFAVTAACSPTGANSSSAAGQSAAATSPRVALVYKGPGSGPDDEMTAELLKALIEKTQAGKLQVKIARPGEFKRQLSREARQNVALVAFPGGPSPNDMRKALVTTGEFDLIKDYVASGGRYFGICAGAFLATYDLADEGQAPELGFDFLPPRGPTDRDTVVEREPGYTDEEAKPRMVPISWQGATRNMYFQNGPVFYFDEKDARIFGRYQSPSKDRSGKIIDPNPQPAAALVTRYGQGKVALSALHPEANEDWLSSDGLPGAAPDYEPGIELITELMKE